MSQQVIQPMVKFQRQVRFSRHVWHYQAHRQHLENCSALRRRMAVLETAIARVRFFYARPCERVDSCRSLGRGITQETEDLRVGEKFRGDWVNFPS